MLPQTFFIIAFIANVLLLIFVSFIAFRNHKKEQKIDAKQNTVLAEAQTILTEANNEAAHRLLDATNFKSEKDQELTQNINKTIQIYQDQLTSNTKRILSAYLQISEKINQDYIHQAEDSLNQLTQINQSETTQLQQIIESEKQALISQMQQSFAFQQKNLEQEIEQYKKVRFAQIEQEITIKAQTILPQILPDIISPEEHQKLIIQALDKAKKEGLI